jgi:hypothetical protein
MISLPAKTFAPGVSVLRPEHGVPRFSDTNRAAFSGPNKTIVPEESLELVNVEHPRRPRL